MAVSATRRVLLLLAIPVLLGLGATAVLVLWSADAGSLIGALGSVDLSWVAAALLAHVLAHLAWAGRLCAVGAGMGIRLGLPQAWRAVTAGVFGASITPARIGGEGLRLLLLQTARAGDATKLVLADRSLDLAFFVAVGPVAAVALPAVFGDSTGFLALTYVGVLVFAALLAALVAIVAGGRAAAVALAPLAGLARLGRPGRAAARVVHEGALHVRDGLRSLVRRPPALLAAAVALTVATWALEFLVPYLLLQALGLHVPLGHVLLGALLVTLLSSVPLTPGSAGVAELAMAALFAPWLAGHGALGPAFVLLWRLLTFYYDLAVGGMVAFHAAAHWLAARAKRPGLAGQIG